MKGKNFLKHVIFFMLMLSVMLGSHTMVQAAETTPEHSITLNKSIYTLKKGKTVKLKATSGKAAKKKAIVWSSSNPKVATVSPKGKVTPRLKAGKNIMSGFALIKQPAGRPTIPIGAGINQ